MATQSSRRIDALTSAVKTPAAAGTGVGSVLLAAVAAIGAATVILQLGGCASCDACESCDVSDTFVGVDQASDPSVPSYREGWYHESAGNFPSTSLAANRVIVPTGEHADFDNADPTSETTTDAVRASLFGDFVATGADGDFVGGDTNLTQVSFAAEGADFDPDLSPDADWLVFSSTQHREQADLYRKSVDGRVVTQLTSGPARDVMPEISPDGRRIAFASDRHGGWDVFVMSVDGGPMVQITFDDAPELHPTWSPDGEHLCYCRFNARTGQWELWTVAIDKPSARSFVCEGMFPRWCPAEDRDRILFQRSRKRGDRLYGVWTIDLVDGAGLNPTEIVAAGDVAIMHPTWSPEGDRIAYTTVSDPQVSEDGMPVECDIWSIGADGTGRVALTSGGYRNLRPDWGSDGRVYFVSNRAGHDVIWAVSGSAPTSWPIQPTTVAEAAEDTPVSGEVSSNAVAGVGDFEDDGQ